MSWQAVAGQKLGEDFKERLIKETTSAIFGKGLEVTRDRAKVKEMAEKELSRLIALYGINLPPNIFQAILNQIVARTSGLGFMEAYLPPACTEFTDIVLNPDGKLFGLRKTKEHFELLEEKVGLEEAWRVVEALLAPTGRSLSEATPTVDARLPRGDGFGGARIKIQHPSIAPGSGYPAISVRIFEQKPVKPEWLVEKKMFPRELMMKLLEWTRMGYRIIVVGETKAGKTTTLSALLDALPKEARIVKIEDPEEIWLDPEKHPNVVTLEARPAIPGSPVPPYTVKDGVDDALRMAPNWLVVGEVRRGDAALSLLRAQMSDHPGLTTFHAAGPEAMVMRLCAIMYADAGVRIEAAKMFIAQAVDIVIWVGFAEGIRKCLGVWEIERTLKGGDVHFRKLWDPAEPQKILEPERKR
ncbi:MAG: CpaF/VirB11 family protein [Candidatus Hadarchaeales archaeon]